MKTEILNSEEITKEMALEELSHKEFMSKEEIDEYLDILTAINEGQAVYNLITNKGEYLLFVDSKAINNTTKKLK